MGIAGSHARYMERETLEERARAELAQRRRQQQAEQATLPALPSPDDNSFEARKAIMQRCDRLDATAEDVAALCDLLARNQLVSAIAAPLEQALSIELEQRFKRPLKRELLRDALAQRRVELGFDSAPALERPLIVHLLLCELRLGNAETVFTATGAMPGGITLPQADYADRQLSAAQRRFLAAAECLARIRRVRVELARVLPDGSATALAVEGPGA